MASAQEGVLVRFGEIGIKSAPVRRRMLDLLKANLLRRMEREGVEGDVDRRASRLWMAGPDLNALVEVACRTFGVVSASRCRVVAATMHAMEDEAARLALDSSEWTTFAVRARREGTHPFSSQDVQVKVGSAIHQAAVAARRTPKVELGHPDLEVHVDVRQDSAYIFTRTHAGPGGLPLGSQGRVVMLLSDEASFVAAWLMMRRGCALRPVHAGTQDSLPRAAVAAAVRWGMPADIQLLPAGSGRVARRTLLEAAGRIALAGGAHAVATGEGLHSPLLTGTSLPVLRPVCGLDAASYRQALAWLRIPALAWPPSIVADDAAEPEAAALDAWLAAGRTVSP